jgi:hypothetical protein
MHIIGIESLVPVLLTSPVVSQPEKLLPSSNLLTILLPQPLRLQPINALLNINPLPTAHPNCQPILLFFCCQAQDNLSHIFGLIDGQFLLVPPLLYAYDHPSRHVPRTYGINTDAVIREEIFPRGAQYAHNAVFGRLVYEKAGAFEEACDAGEQDY